MTELPKGYVLVPVEPTEEMVAEGFEAIRMEERWPSLLDRVYRAMISARPLMSEGEGVLLSQPCGDGAQPILPPSAEPSAAFTPGPWFWTEGRDGYPTSLRRSGSGDVVLQPDNTPGEYGWVDISEPDARLIAAAPSLLSALRALNESILGRAESNASGNPEWEYVSARVNDARTAIGKALGSNPKEPGS